MNTETKTLDWIDILKGIGILTVVYAHIHKGTITDFIYLFHMPLFFFISGYLSKPTTQYKKYFSKKATHLLLPYSAFLSIILIPFNLVEAHEPAQSVIFRALFGGTYLHKWCGVFWFVTTLFLTQQAFNILATMLKEKQLCIAIIISLILAYINNAYFQRHSFPWSANIVFYSLPFYYCGHLYKRYTIPESFKKHLITAILLLAVLILFYNTNSNTIVDLKFAQYGIPFLSFASGVILIHSLIIVSKTISMTTRLAHYLKQIGIASMFIMYLHQPIQFILLDYFRIPELARLIAATLLPLTAYYFASKSQYLSLVFLGRRTAKQHKLN